MTSGAHVSPLAAHLPTSGIASPAPVQCTRSAEVRTGTFAAALLVPYAYQVSSCRITPGSGKLSVNTGLVNIAASDGWAAGCGAEAPQPADRSTSASRPALTTG